MRKQKSTAPSQEENEQRIRNLAQLTPYDVMRLQNCKPFTFRKDEMYPSIRPPFSQCNKASAIDLFSKTMLANGCGCFNPKLLRRSKRSIDAITAENTKINELGYPGKNMFKPCRTCRQRKPKEEQAENLIDLVDLKPYDLMRMQNCKTYNFKKCESYPSIRPPVSQCSPAQTAEWLIDAVEDAGCGRYFDMEQDDVMDVWKNTPNKDMLSYYGVSSGQRRPEADVFNQAITKSLEMATEVKTVEPKTESAVPPVNLESTGPCSGPVLNRPLLQTIVTNMPMVRKKLNARDSLRHVYCPRPVANENPFTETHHVIPLSHTFGMDRPAPKRKHGLRRKWKYCNLQCYIRENKCTDYEWMKYKLDPKPYEEAFKREMAELDQGGDEPKNYDELYSQLVASFETYNREDPLCKLYDKCCRRPKKRVPKDVVVPPVVVDRRAERPKPFRKPPKKEPPQDEVKEPEVPKKVEKPPKEKPKKEEPVKEEPQEEEKPKDKPKKQKKPKKPKEEKPKEEKPKEEEPKAEKPEKEKPKKPPKQVEEPPKETEIESYKIPDEPEHIDKQPPETKPDREQSTWVHPPTPVEKPKKLRKPKRKPVIPKPPPPPEEKVPDCPCEICEFMKRRQLETDTPLIRKLKQEQKRQQLRDYYKRMCYREYKKCCKPTYRAPQHKCDPIKCDNIFCRDPKLGQYCECLDAMQQLQKLLGPKHSIVRNELIFNVEDLKNRICGRFCDCL